KLRILPLPAGESGLVCIHFQNVDEALRANIIALKYSPTASELIDHYILDCTKESIEYRNYRFFVQGEPGAILVVEYRGETREVIEEVVRKMQEEMQTQGLGYYFPLLFGEDSKKIWALRKAGLGLLGNMPGDQKAVPVIEDTAVDVQDLPAYIREFNEILKKYNLYSVHYAHAGSGEIHLRPILDLKTVKGNALFREIAGEIAVLVKKYQGSLSGEHGDGRLRGEFIRQMIGEKNYGMLRELKQTWDPQGIFNPQKIVDTPPMNTMLRFTPGQSTPPIPTYFHFGQINILQHAEQCNGSGDCRKTPLSGGTMCPSFMATRNEKDTTRARANILREFLTHSTKANRFNHAEIYDVMDLCLSCKGCKSECPSNVDVAKLKMEFLQQYYDANGIPFRTRIIGHYGKLTSLAANTPGIYNFLTSNKWTSGLIKKMAGFALERSLPRMQKITLKKWATQHQSSGQDSGKKKVFLFCDEFTNYTDAQIGRKAILLLEGLGYSVIIPQHLESGRAYLSKGLLRTAKKIAEKNILFLKDLVTEDCPIIGIEPSAILCFRDEYPDLVNSSLQVASREISSRTFLIDEFLDREINAGNLNKNQFTKEYRHILLHGHCQQKAISSLQYTKNMLCFPENYSVEIIPSGCCGMAGSFGYEKEHYNLSMKIGEMVLFPQIREAPKDTIISAPGTSCRHQIKDGTGQKSYHPIEILFDAFLPTGSIPA
ncbi:MAG: FAD-binding and (Fe-S)-binding domain-containing protein, partial [Chitinophagaceae bacterium]